TFELPFEEVERISSIPGTVFTAPSTWSVTSVSISAGAAPGFDVDTEIVGRSIFGNRSTPSVKKLNPPTTVKNITMTVANTGRCTQISANHCIKLYKAQSPRSPTDYVSYTCSPRLSVATIFNPHSAIPNPQSERRRWY